MNDFRTWTCVAVVQPAMFHGFPQLLGESKVFRILRFLRPSPLHDRAHDHGVLWNVVVRNVSAQHLSVSSVTVPIGLLAAGGQPRRLPSPEHNNQTVSLVDHLLIPVLRTSRDQEAQGSSIE